MERASEIKQVDMWSKYYTVHPETKMRVVPEEWKPRIDQILEDELLSANRVWVMKDPLLAKEIDQLSELGSVAFLEELKKRWVWHNKFYEEVLEPMLPYLKRKSHHELTDEDAQTLAYLYEAMDRVDRDTIAISAAIKKHVDREIEKNSVGLSPEEKSLLATPPTETFFAEFIIDHLRYLLARRHDTSDHEFIHRELLKKYHLNDETVFFGRFKKFQQKYEGQSDADVTRVIESYTIDREKKIKHGYLTLENPTRKALRDILVFDNYVEKMLANRLVGVSGFVLRKEILRHLNESEVLPNNGNIYEQDSQIVTAALGTLGELRKSTMLKDVTHLQQKEDECSSTSLAMACSRLLDGQSTETLPNLIRTAHEKSVAKGMPGEMYSGLASFAQESGLNTTLVHSEQDLFSNKQERIPQDLFGELVEQYKGLLSEAVINGSIVQTGVDINNKVIKPYLEAGNLVVLALELPNHILHSVLVVGYEDGLFMYHDPLDHKGVRKEKFYGELEDMAKTSVGSWFLALNNKPKDINHSMKVIEDEFRQGYK